MPVEAGVGDGWTRPGRRLLWTEPARAFAEFGTTGALLPVLRRAPKGDGHSVVVLPGWMASDNSTRLLRWFLRDLGYDSHGWGLGRNIGPTDGLLDALVRRVVALQVSTRRQVSLVGWSLGGVFAREIARAEPNAVRCVITMGSPFASFTATREPISVPTTAIYSKADGIVPWQACIGTENERTENIRVSGSHVGLGHNPRVLTIIADRLAQPPGAWKPYSKG